MSVLKVTRRDLLLSGGIAAAAGSAGLVLGVWYGQRKERWRKRVPPRDQAFAPSVYLAIDSDDTVTVYLTKTEMGQGVSTALPLILAEELKADWRRLRVVQAIANDNYGNMLTGVSTSVKDNFEELRRAGAAAREMLIAAGAASFGAPAADCRAEDGVVIHVPTGRRARYGELARAAAELPVPAAPRLEPRAEWRRLGRPTDRLDAPAKVDGSAIFGMDVKPAGLLYAAIARPPSFGGAARGFDDAKARATAGVVDVVQISGGVAVLARSTWAALAGKRALEVTWAPGQNAALSSASIAEALVGLAATEGRVVFQHGDPEAALGSSPVEATYRLPYLAHAPMEPINCTARLGGGKIELWAPNQNPSALQALAASLTGLQMADVIVHTTYAGCGFGRRVEQAEWVDAIELAKHVGGAVQVVWTREDDLRNDCYRPIALHRMRGALDAEGWPIAWHHRGVSPSILARDPRFKDPIDPVAVEGCQLPYTLAHARAEWVPAELPVPLGFWRSVGHSHNALAVECFIDELAAAGGKDPAEVRRRLLANAPRELAVLNLALEKAGWGAPLPPGRGRGVAFHSSFGSHAAQVAEVSVEAGRVRVHRVVVAVDAGIVVNPDGVAAQMEGGVVFGLSAALYGEITLEDGGVRQSNFHDYPILRFSEMPAVEVHLVDSDEAPGGIGEVGVPPIAPAVLNGLFAATGRRIRALPIRI